MVKKIDTVSQPSVKLLEFAASQIATLPAAERQALRRLWSTVQRIPASSSVRHLEIAELLKQIAAAQRRIEQKLQSLPPLNYPDSLPIAQHRTLLLEAIRNHQVVIIAGETGSGKTTQIPKIALELGRAAHGMIGHTQPRRLAARTVAQRLAYELSTPLGGIIGYQVRFSEMVGENTLVKVMTDGILLAEIHRDRWLNQYGTLIIDEAHERSLNIDFILGYLKQLLPKRPDLKLIITSATLDPQRFSDHFGQAPLFTVSGRSYPVEVRYRPTGTSPDGAPDQLQGIIAAIEELNSEPTGDILVFMSGEREIRDTAEILEDQSWPHTEILPLYARLASSGQQRIFRPHSGRRIVLATNVAETSLTIPGIRFVIDPGTARISRYSYRSKVQQLPIEPISQASAEQRKGRCGRIAPGICIRLYSEQDFLSRAPFTEPAILRTRLSAVILQMMAAGLTQIESFPFIDPPNRHQLNDGLRQLEDLGALERAVEEGHQLTKLGRELAQLPLDPLLGRILLAAGKLGSLHELLIITAALSIQDPRERPIEKQQAASQQHRRFFDPKSDFLSWIKLWNYLKEQQQTLTAKAFRNQCQAEFLHYARVREWQEVYSQLRQATKELRLAVNQAPADYRTIHEALLCGMLRQIGQKNSDKEGYTGAGGTNFAIFPGSALFKKGPNWVVAAELVTTSRPWGRCVAAIEPEWLESLAPPHLLKRSYSEPHWEKRSASTVALEKVTLYGLPIVARRRVNYGRLDPPLARELFIRHALIGGEWQAEHQFLRRNQVSLEEARALEEKSRRRDLVVDEEVLFAFYEERIPNDVVSGAHFDRWWREVSRQKPQLLDFTSEMLLEQEIDQLDMSLYPDFWPYEAFQLPLSYQFNPESGMDGVTVTTPIFLLNRLSPHPFAWQIAGLRPQLITALLKTLPKMLRRNFVPTPDYVAAFMQRPADLHHPISEALSTALYQMSGAKVPTEAWRVEQIPAFLKITFRVVDRDGVVLGEGKDLLQLREELKEQSDQQVASTMQHKLERQGLTWWDFTTIPQYVAQEYDSYTIKRFPALVDERHSVAIRLFDSETEQHQQMFAGIARLLYFTIPSPLSIIQSKLDATTKLRLAAFSLATLKVVLDDALLGAIQHLVRQHSPLVWSREEFQELTTKVTNNLDPLLLEVVQQLAALSPIYNELQKSLKRNPGIETLLSYADMREQLANLIYPGFITESGPERLKDLRRYLLSIQRRLEKLTSQPQLDELYRRKIATLQLRYREKLSSCAKDLPVPADLQQVRWMIEELRVSYFAQNLGTPYPISEQRIVKKMQQGK